MDTTLQEEEMIIQFTRVEATEIWGVIGTMSWIEEIQLCQLCCLGDIALSGRYYHVSFCKQHSPTEILSLRLFSQEVGKRKWLSTFISQHVWHFLTWLLQDRDNWDTGLRCALVQTLVICLGVGIWLRDRGLVSWYIMITHQLPSHLASFGNIHLGYQRGWRYMMSALEVTVAKDQVDATWKQIWRWGCDIRNTWHEMVVFVMSCFSLDTVHQLVLKNFEIDLRKRYSLGLPWFASMSCMLRVQRKASAELKRHWDLSCKCWDVGVWK